MKKRKDGRYVKSIVDERTGKRVYFYGSTEREVNKKVLAYTTKAEEGRTFKEVADEWWNEKSDIIANGTRRSYHAAYVRAVEEFGDDLISEVRPRDVDRYLRSLVKLNYTSKSIKNDKLVISLICDYAVIEGDILYNPCASIPAPKGKANNTRHAASKEDEEQIKAYPDAWIFPYIAIYTGMRKGEILALQWGDIDFDADIITVSRSAELIGSRAVIKSPKTQAGIRTIVLLSPLKEALLKHPCRRATDYIVSDTGGSTPLTAKQFARHWKEYRALTGVTCTAHQLRHSFATQCFEAGLPDKVVQHMIGHTSITTTKDIYIDIRKNMLEGAKETLENALKK
jgi:integrase